MAELETPVGGVRVWPLCRYRRAHDDPTHGSPGHRGRRPCGCDGVLRRLCYVRGPKGIIVELAEQIG